MISFFIEYAEYAIIKENTPCNFIFQHNRKQMLFVMCDVKNRKVCLVAKIYSKFKIALCTVRYCSMRWCVPRNSLNIAPRLTKWHETA